MEVRVFIPRLIRLVNKSWTFWPRFIYQRILLVLAIVIACSCICHTNYLLSVYLILGLTLVLVHSIACAVTEESLLYYERTLLYISVNGDTQDHEDLYLNGYADIQMSKKAK